MNCREFLATMTATAATLGSARIATAQQSQKLKFGYILAPVIRENRTEQLQTGLRLQETVQASASAATRFLSSRNPADSNAATAEVSANIAGVSQAAVNSGHSAAAVLAAASDLSSQSVALQREVDAFLSSIRTA